MIVTECKSGNTAPLDRIFWLTGVRNYTGAAQAVNSPRDRERQTRILHVNRE